MKSKAISAQEAESKDMKDESKNLFQQLNSSFHQMYGAVVSTKLNRTLLAVDLTAADIAFGFPIAAKLLYEINIHNPTVNSANIGPAILFSSTAISAAISFYLYEKVISRLSKLKRQSDTKTTICEQ